MTFCGSLVPNRCMRPFVHIYEHILLRPIQDPWIAFGSFETPGELATTINIP
jgi:hypothetical protein